MTREQARVIAREIVSKMTVEEKASQLLYNSPAIERLGIKEYNWWNEASHGVARAGTATVFPHALALAATFSPELVHSVAKAISDEGRAKYNMNLKLGDHDIFKGITFWAPNINIFRDPRWGRGQETFGEDPFLTASLAVKFIKGIQGDGEFLKAAACAKHFAGHSGPEKLRHGFDAIISQKDLHETYLPAFYYCVKAGVEGVMGAYNRTNGEPCCASKALMDILFNRWSFEGYFVSDCWAISDIFQNHKCVDSMAEAAAMALNAGCDLNCGCAYDALIDAYEQDLVTEEQITAAAEKLYTTRALLGEFEEIQPYADIPFSVVDCPEHRALNLESARRSLVLLKNDGLLPLDADNTKKIAVVGPNAMSVTALEGNYNGYASQYITVADGIRAAFPESDVRVAVGSQLCFEEYNNCGGFANLLSDGVATASQADITVLCLGLDRTVEGEEIADGDAYTDGGDKRGMLLPKTQQKLAEAVCDVCENVVVVLISGGALDLGDKVRSHARAIIQAFYPGALGGRAIAGLIAGEFSPSGRLPVTFHREGEPLPDFTDYSMRGRTYRYIDTEPLYPFGYGLSYTKFEYSDILITAVSETHMRVSAYVTNAGEVKSRECVQVYAAYSDSRTDTPNYQLCGLVDVELEPGEQQRVSISLERFWLSAVLPDGSRVEPDGEITIYIGGHQPDERSCELCGDRCLSKKYK